MNLYNIWVSLSEMSDQKYMNLFHDIHIFWDVPVVVLDKNKTSGTTISWLFRPDLIYISLLIIFCIIEDVTNKRTLNLYEHT